MDYKHSVGILTEYIKEIEEIIGELDHSKKIPAIDVDLLLDKTRNFYEMLLMLKKNVDISEKTVIVEEKREIQEKKEKIVENIVTPAETTLVKEIENVQIEEVKSTIQKPDEEQKILSDRFKKQKASLNESISQSKTFYDLSSKIQSKPLENISAAIGLNEKFSFIHTLFRGDATKYNETIQVLNNSTNFNEAYNYLNETFDWDMNSEPVQKILDLIRRKFIVNKNG